MEEIEKKSAFTEKGEVGQTESCQIKKHKICHITIISPQASLIVTNHMISHPICLTYCWKSGE